MNDDQTQTTPAHLRGIFDTALHDEPPLVDMVSGAVSGARARKHRDRLAMVVASTVVLAMGAAAYTVLPGFGPSGSNRVAAAASPTSSRPVYPPVADSEPLNATPEVHAAAVRICTRDWSNALVNAGNTLPATEAEAVDMCTMVGETLMTLLPDAKVTLADAPDVGLAGGSGEQWTVTTSAGKTIMSIHYLWPDGSYGKQHYGPSDECPSYVSPATPAMVHVTGPDGKPSSFAMNDPNAGHVRQCVQTRPAQQFYGALVIDRTADSIWYSVQNHDYGRYMIGNGTVYTTTTTKPTAGSFEENTKDGKFVYSVPDPNNKPALTMDEWAKVFTDPRFNDFMARYEMYVLTHGTAQSFVESGSKPLAKG